MRRTDRDRHTGGKGWNKTYESGRLGVAVREGKDRKRKGS